MKKLLAMVLAMLMLVSITACGTSSAPAETAAPTETAAAATEATAAAEESTEATYTVGICQLVQHPALDAATQGFRDALTEKLGDRVVFDEANAQGEATTCSTIVTGFVANEYDLIMANATPALLASVTATKDTGIPVLGTSVTDYASALELELDSNGATGINASGTSDGVPAQLYADCLMELVPDAKNVSIVYCSSEPNSVLQADQFIACMDELNVATKVFTFADSNDIQTVVTSAIEGADALYIPTDNTAASNMTIIANICQPAGIPVICGEEGMCSGGGLATVSISYYDIGHVCGEMAYDILVNGADVSMMPVGYSENPVKKYNADYAAAIDFQMPDSYEVIE